LSFEKGWRFIGLNGYKTRKTLEIEKLKAFSTYTSSKNNFFTQVQRTTSFKYNFISVYINFIKII